MIDIHTHIIFNVDDGSDSLTTSIKMIEKEIMDGTTDIVLTPHFNKRDKSFNKLMIIEHYNQLIREVKVRNLKVNLYLGYEVYFKDGMVNEISDYTINKSKYILVEFSTVNTTDIEELAYELVSNGYIPILAHVERYQYLSLDDYINIRNTGALFQVNAATVIGKHGFRFKRLFKKLLALGLVDFIASDMHNLNERTSYLKEAYTYINKKYGKETADTLFINNQRKILEKIK
jgi:protein-tyrosine phosphatase